MAEPIELIFLPVSGAAEDAELLADLTTWLAQPASEGTFRLVAADVAAPSGNSARSTSSDRSRSTQPDATSASGEGTPGASPQVIRLPASPDLAAQRDLWEAPLVSALERQQRGEAAVFALHLRPRFRADLEGTARLLGTRVPAWLNTLLQVLEAQSQQLQGWDPASDPDGLLVQLRDGAFDAGATPSADDLRQRVEEALRTRGRPWLRRRTETSHGTGRLLGAHDGAVTAVTMSEDGRLALSGSEDGTVKCWSLERGTLAADLPGHTDAVRDIVLTPDNRIAISASDDGTLKVWSLPDGAEQSTLDWHHAGVYSVVVGSDGRTAESRSYDGHSCLWDLTTGHPITASAATSAPMPRAPASAGDVAVTASPEHDLLVQSVSSGQVQRTLVGHTGRVLCMALHEGGRRLVSGGADWTVRLWDTARGAPRVPSGEVAATAIPLDGRFAVSAGVDGTLAVWETATGILRRTLSTEPARDVHLAALPGPCVLVASGATIEIWDLDAGQLLRTLVTPVRDVLAVAASPTGRRAAMVAGSRLFLWDLEAGALVHMVDCEASATGIAVLDDERVLIAEPRAQAVRCVSFETGQTTHTFAGLGELTGALLAAPAAGRFFCSTPNAIVVADAESGKALRSLPLAPSGSHPVTAARCLSVTPDGRFLALASPVTDPRPRTSTGALVLYDVAEERLLGRLRLAFPPASCSLSPDGNTLFFGASVEVRRQVVKGWRDGGVGGWFKENILTQARVFFVDLTG